MKGENIMNEYGTAKTALMNNNTDRLGGIAMKAIKQVVGLIKKVLSEENRTDVPCDFYREQQMAQIRTESYIYADMPVIK